MECLLFEHPLNQFGLPAGIDCVVSKLTTHSDTIVIAGRVTEFTIRIRVSNHCDFDSTKNNTVVVNLPGQRFCQLNCRRIVSGKASDDENTIVP